MKETAQLDQIPFPSSAVREAVTYEETPSTIYVTMDTTEEKKTEKQRKQEL
jgi:hypothetical protein